MVSPTLMVIGFGEKAKFAMSALTELAARAVAAVSRKSTISSAGMSERLSDSLDQRRCASIESSHTSDPQVHNWGPASCRPIPDCTPGRADRFARGGLQVRKLQV